MLTCVHLLMFDRFSVVQRRGAASEGFVPSFQVQAAAAEGHQPDAGRQRSVHGDAHRPRKKSLLPAACCLLQGYTEKMRN